MKNIIGIRREDKSKWERRVPLVPHDINELKKKYGISFQIQPSDNRAYKDKEYTRIGVELNEYLVACNVVIGIKEFHNDFFMPGRAYIFFSHTGKGQSHNMTMLRRLMELGCTLVDYEYVKDHEGRRLIFFGRYAGRAGMVDTLWALGRRFEFEGFKTPFHHIKQAYEYLSVGRAKKTISEVADELSAGALPAELRPLIFGFTGYGNVSQGAQRILDILNPQELAPDQIDLVADDPDSNGLYKVVFREEHIVENVDPKARFELQDYYGHPEKYRSKFAQYVPHLTVLMNCNYWDERYPRLLTRSYTHKLYSDKSTVNRLKVIGDISCDIEGGIECTLRCTQPDMPVYVYDSITGNTIPGWEGNGPVILAVDNLPAEFAWESSMFFSEVLRKFIPDIAVADFDLPYEELKLPNEIKNAIILHKGKFTPKYRYMEKYLE